MSNEFPHFLQYATSLRFLDLSYNKFSGSVPIWVVEKMPSLEVLILRSNMFHGHLPRQLSRIVGLHYLDIAHNNISGIIPSSLERLRAMADDDNSLLQIKLSLSTLSLPNKKEATVSYFHERLDR